MVIKCKLHKAGARAEIYFHVKLKMGVLELWPKTTHVSKDETWEGSI